MATYSAGGSARIRSYVFRHRLMTGVAVGVGLGLTALVLTYFEPQKLFLDQRVNEAAPAAPAARGEPSVVASAEFRSLEHETTGQAIIQQLPDGSRVLRLENFQTSNGPDLRVYLSAGSSDASFGAEYGEDFVELGELKGNIGDQNYAIPTGLDFSKYRNAVIWCKRFSVGFGVATLQ